MFKFDVPGSNNVFLSLSVWFAFSKQTKFYILLKHKRILGCAPAESNTARAYTTSIICHRVAESDRRSVSLWRVIVSVGSVTAVSVSPILIVWPAE